MYFNILKNKNIAILGLGITGVQTAKVLEHYKDKLIIIDDNPSSKYVLELQTSGYIIKTTKEVLDSDYIIDVIIKSPGIPFEHMILKKFESAKKINDIELAYDYIKENKKDIKIIVVTATNGKTSTVMFIEKILHASGKNVKSAGNIGISPLVILKEFNELDYLILELSSFQLTNIDKFKADYAFLLNISPDHLDIHGTFENYVNSKKRVYLNQTEKDYLFTKHKVYDAHLKNEEIKSKIIFNDIDNNVKSKIDNFKNKSINFNNLILIYKLCEVLNISESLYFDTLKKFKNIEHRMEFVKEIGGIRYYNDSKSTNLNSLKEAIKNIENIILIVGGISKTENLSDFKNYLSNVKIVIAYGTNRNKFLSNKVKYRVNDLDEALKIASKIAVKHDSVILSPASASFDQYENYISRGNHFKKLIKEMREV